LIVAVTVGILVAVSVALLIKKRKQTFRDGIILTPASTLVVLGIIFGDDFLLVYSFIGSSVVLSIIAAILAK